MQGPNAPVFAMRVYRALAVNNLWPLALDWIHL